MFIRNRRFTIDELQATFPQVSRSMLCEIFSEKLQYKKSCAGCVQKMLTEEHKEKHVGASISFLECNDKDGDECLNHIVTILHNGDETSIRYTTHLRMSNNPKKWYNSNSPKKLIKLQADHVNNKNDGYSLLEQERRASG